MGVGGAYRLAGEQHAHADLEGKLSRDPVHAARRRHQADVDLRRAELRRLVGDDQVARQGDLEPAADSVAVHRGDDRLPALEVARDAAEDDLGSAGVRLSPSAVLGVVLQVVARAEGPLA